MMCPENEECWFGTCSHESCGFADVYSLPNEPHLTELPAKWNKWQDIEGWLVKHEETGGVANLHSCIESIATKFFKHCFVKRLQSKSYEADKAKSANPDSDTAVLQMNFADNFTCMAQDEVQSAHWNQAQVTLFTAVTGSSAMSHDCNYQRLSAPRQDFSRRVSR